MREVRLKELAVKHSLAAAKSRLDNDRPNTEMEDDLTSMSKHFKPFILLNTFNQRKLPLIDMQTRNIDVYYRSLGKMHRSLFETKIFEAFQAAINTHAR
jgi:hypothetical protein